MLRSLRTNLGSLAAIAVLVAFLRWASPIAGPVLLSALLAVAFAPLVRIRPGWVGLTLALLVSLGSLAVCAATLSFAATGLGRRLPEYLARFDELQGELVAWLAARRVAPEAVAPLTSLERAIEPGLMAAADLLTLALSVALLTGFFVVEASLLPKRLAHLDAAARQAFTSWATRLRSVQAYMLVKMVVSALTGLAAGVLTHALGIPHPVLWGLLAFLLNFIPIIGSVVAAIPPTLLALLLMGPGMAVFCGLGYLGINFVVGWVIEPKLAGEAVGLSPLAVVLSLIFWGWVLGPIGALVSAPLTMALRVLLLHEPGWRWLGVLLGGRHPDDRSDRSGRGWLPWRRSADPAG